MFCHLMRAVGRGVTWIAYTTKDDYRFCTTRADDQASFTSARESLHAMKQDCSWNESRRSRELIQAHVLIMITGDVRVWHQDGWQVCQARGCRSTWEVEQQHTKGYVTGKLHGRRCVLLSNYYRERERERERTVHKHCCLNDW